MPQWYNSSACHASLKKIEENFCLIPWMTSIKDSLRNMLISLIRKDCRVTYNAMKTSIGAILLNFTGIVSCPVKEANAGINFIVCLAGFRRRQLWLLAWPSVIYARSLFSLNGLRKDIMLSGIFLYKPHKLGSMGLVINPLQTNPEMVLRERWCWGPWGRGCMWTGQDLAVRT